RYLALYPLVVSLFFRDGVPRHLLSFPTRRSSDLFSSWLQVLGWVDGPVEMLYNDVAVIIGLVYNGLLFMVVPLVTTLDGMDENLDRKSTRLNSSHVKISYAVFCLKKKKTKP